MNYYVYYPLAMTILTRSTTRMGIAGMKVLHDSVTSTFRVISPSGDEMGYLEYRLQQIGGDNVADFYHTFTSPGYRGQGVGAAAVKSALDWARENHLRVTPSCSYVSSFLEKHREYTSLL